MIKIRNTVDYKNKGKTERRFGVRFSLILQSIA